MAAPTRESVTSTDFGSDATAHAANMPATVTAGDLLLAVVAIDSAAETIATPSGWTLLYRTSSDPTTCIYGKVAVGDEDGTTVDWVTTGSERGTIQVHRITGWGGSLTGSICMGGDHGVGTTDGFALTPVGGSQDILWIASQSKSTASTFDTSITNFTGEATSGQNSSTGAAIRSAYRQLTAATIEVAECFLSASGAPFQMIAILPTALSASSGAGFSYGSIGG